MENSATSQKNSWSWFIPIYFTNFLVKYRNKSISRIKDCLRFVISARFRKNIAFSRQIEPFWRCFFVKSDFTNIFFGSDSMGSNWRKFLTALKLPPKKYAFIFFVPPSWLDQKFPRGRRGCTAIGTTPTTPWSSTTSAATTASKFLIVMDRGVPETRFPVPGQKTREIKWINLTEFFF